MKVTPTGVVSHFSNRLVFPLLAPKWKFQKENLNHCPYCNEMLISNNLLSSLQLTNGGRHLNVGNADKWCTKLAVPTSESTSFSPITSDRKWNFSASPRPNLEQSFSIPMISGYLARHPKKIISVFFPPKEPEFNYGPPCTCSIALGPAGTSIRLDKVETRAAAEAGVGSISLSLSPPLLVAVWKKRFH